MLGLIVTRGKAMKLIFLVFLVIGLFGCNAITAVNQRLCCN